MEEKVDCEEPDWSCKFTSTKSRTADRQTSSPQQKTVGIRSKLLSKSDLKRK